MTIDTSKEAVERLALLHEGISFAEATGSRQCLVDVDDARFMHSLAAESDAQTARADAAEAEVSRLTAELTALRAGQDALVAAAYEAAAEWLMTVPQKLPNRDQYAKHVRALTTADATAALDAKLRAERNKVRREVAKLYENGGGPGLGGWDYFGDFYDAILAMIEPEGK